MIKILDLNFLGISKSIASFLVETKEGPILIETGPYSTYDTLKQKINEAGYQLEDIKHVLLTHIHLDHAGAAWALAKKGANIYMHPSGAPHLNEPSKLIASAKRIYKDDMDRLWSTINPIDSDKIKVVDDQEDLLFGDVKIRAFYTPGHASHHIAWLIEDMLFTGDVAGVRVDNGPVVAPCPPPDIDVDSWLLSIALIRSLRPRQMYLTHFGIVEDTNNHLDELERNISTYAQWVKIKWQEGEEKEKIVESFEEFAMRDLEKRGVPKENMPKYQSANPAWMSVEGLIRYWKKKKEED